MSLPTVHLICNAHLDPVWQWRWEEGCAEALSTFATAADLLDEHPGLIFNHNEAVLYGWVRRYNPALFARIQSLVAAGRWAISGGWYLQPDVNLPGTESLIRHMELGRQFFKAHFGATPRVAYNFDSFGHSAGLPQLLRLSGFQMYIHMRPQASDLVLPADLYHWRGLDGTEILALRIVVGLYHTERDNIEQRLSEGVDLALKLKRDVPVFWGIGNHGGGPTREDLRRIDAFMASEKRVRLSHSTPERLYEALKHTGESAPVVTGDLQRVFTGCYTSLARVKRQAVRSLGGLVQTEALRAATWWLWNQPYPEAQLQDAWCDHLFNDFHDILPGSCIEPAEQDALGLYARAGETVRRLRLEAATAFNGGPSQPAYIPLTVLNASPGCRSVPVEAECMLDLRPKWSGTWHLRVFNLEGRELPCQEEQPESLLPFNGWRRKVVFMADLPALGARQYKLEICEGQPSLPAAAPALPHYLDPGLGLVTSLGTPDGRPCLGGPLLKPLVIEDLADSWGTNHSSYRKVVGELDCVPGSVTCLAAGPIRTVTESVHRFGRSEIVLHTIAYAAFPALEFRFRVQWNEERRRLKLSVPTTLKSDTVLCEVPGGAWERPADGQEHVHGRWLLVQGQIQDRPAAVGIIHDGLHGFDVQDGEIRLSVLRSAAYCHEQGFKIADTPRRKFMDQGVHALRLLVIAGDPEDVRTRVNGLADWLAAPPPVYAHLPLGPAAQTTTTPLEHLLESLPANLRLLACRPAAGDNGLCLRLQETCGRAAEINPLPALSSGFTFRPFEIKTLQLDRAGAWREVNSAL